jgi:hypothetical protein
MIKRKLNKETCFKISLATIDLCSWLDGAQSKIQIIVAMNVSLEGMSRMGKYSLIKVSAIAF